MRLFNHRNILTAVVTLLTGSTAFTQVKPNGGTVPTVSNVPALEQANLGATINYVRTWDAWKPITNATQVTQQTIANVKVNTAYVDGQGRVIQTVSKQISASGKDMVSYKQFDQYGRETIQPLAYASTDSTGDFKVNPFSGQQYYYSTGAVNNNQYTGEQIYFGRTAIETSPLGRPDTVMAPGNSWAGSNRGVRYKYELNTISDSVRIWMIADAANSTPATSSRYDEGELTKNTTIDEDGNKTIEYKDRQGMIILKKVQLDSTAGTAHVGWICTYYIYDDYGSLRVVVQPQAVAAMLLAGNWTISTLMDELCFRYEYDQRDRMIIKKVPGAGEVHLVYDARDRVVMTQDANIRNGSPVKWLYTQYDLANRVTASGLLQNSSSRATHQTAAYNSTSYPSLSGQTYDELTSSIYDVPSGVFSTRDVSKLDAGNNPWPETVTNSELVYGKLTRTVANTLGISLSGGGNKNFFYDEKGRMIQVHCMYGELVYDTITNRYDFNGKLIASYQRHINTASSQHSEITIRSRIEFDDAGRATKVWKRVNDANEKQIVLNSYDELGQLKSKILAPEFNSNTGLETLNYKYNISGWMKAINDDYANGTNNTNWFGQTLSYDHGFTAQAYNGNISGWQWRSKGDGEQRAYGFTYDKLNRFISGDFTQYTGSAWNTSGGIDFTANNMSYDANGNILSMNHKGWKLGGSVTIDDLAYTYTGNTNKLLKVIDGITAENKLGDFYDGTNGSNNDYSYDDNGNLTVDNNKAISGISYTHLNLPAAITITDKGTISYGYSATGEKLVKQVEDEASSMTTVTTYYNGIIYQNDILQFFSHEEGRIRPKDTSFVFDYFIKDHLGNVRMVLTDEQQTDMYPAATMEEENAELEETYYSNLPESREDAPEAYPVSEEKKVARLGAASSEGGGGIGVGVGSDPADRELVKIGPAILLKVMAGDHFSLNVNSWYRSGEPEADPEEVLTDLLHLFSLSSEGINGSHPSSSDIENSTELTNSMTSFLESQTWDSSRPKAYVNWIVLDERFDFVSSNSGFEQIGEANEYSTHTRDSLPVDKNGYLYIYVSNASPEINVYYDNLQVTHIRGPLVEENHYYPFGLVQQGISSKALAFGDPRNKEKTFQGQRFDDEFDLNWVQFKWRNHDPQIGRFIEIDPLSDKYVYYSTYAFSGNRVTNHVELEGLEPSPVWDADAMKRHKDAGLVNSTKAREWSNTHDWISFTAVITKGDGFALSGKAGFMQIGITSTENEYDAGGIRDNKVVEDGVEVRGDETKVTRSTDSFELGFGFKGASMGVGAGKTVETRSWGGVPLEETTTEWTTNTISTKVKGKDLKAESIKTKAGEGQINTSCQLVGVKIHAFGIGVEAGVTITSNPYTNKSSPPPPRNGWSVDNTANNMKRKPQLP